MVGTHRRLRANDVIAYRARRDDRLAAVSVTNAADDDLGITR